MEVNGVHSPQISTHLDCARKKHASENQSRSPTCCVQFMAAWAKVHGVLALALEMAVWTRRCGRIVNFHAVWFQVLRTTREVVTVICTQIRQHCLIRDDDESRGSSLLMPKSH